jgi:hypothetical protein
VTTADRATAEPVVPTTDRGTGPPGQHRQEFVRAFVEHSWTRPGSERPAAKPHVVLTVTTLAAVLALAAGVVLQLIHPVKLTKALATPTAPALGFVAVAGWDCAATATSGFEATGRAPSWNTIAVGGWAQDGCHGDFEAMPIADQASPDPQDPSAVWWFAPRAVTHCSIAVFVPDRGGATYRAATAVRFDVLAGRGGQGFAQFVVDQSAHAGSWVVVGTYPTTSSGIAVLMVSQAATPSPDVMLAITQVKVACTG